MEKESQAVLSASAGDDSLVPAVYENRTKGLRKERLSFHYTSLEKPSELCRCQVIIRDVSDVGSHVSNYLNANTEEQWLTIGTAITPIDCYVELLLQQMLTNEESRCMIKTKTSEVSFTMKLLRIDDHKYYYQLSFTEMLELVKRYKENGVKMFPKYPLFAHAYFNRAVKCLLSLSVTEEPEATGSKEEVRSLLETLYLNISACLIKQNRYDEVPHVLQYTNAQEIPSTKATYRKALAHYMLKQFPEAIATLQKIDYASSKECVALHKQIIQARQQDDSNYNTMVKKMFG